MDKRRSLIVAVIGVAAIAALVRGTHRTGGGPPERRAVSTEATALHAFERPASARSESTTVAIVYIAGEVRRPGVYRVAADARVESALRLAGGMTAAADPVAVNLAERLRDGEEVVVPARGALTNYSARGSAARPRRRAHSHAARGGGRARKPPPEAPVDVNAADASALQALPGVGPRLAERIVAFRDANGPFASPDDLLDVNGVSDKLLAQIEPYLRF